MFASISSLYAYNIIQLTRKQLPKKTTKQDQLSGHVLCPLVMRCDDTHTHTTRCFSAKTCKSVCFHTNHNKNPAHQKDLASIFWSGISACSWFSASWFANLESPGRVTCMNSKTHAPASFSLPASCLSKVLTHVLTVASCCFFPFLLPQPCIQHRFHHKKWHEWHGFFTCQMFSSTLLIL